MEYFKHIDPNLIFAVFDYDKLNSEDDVRSTHFYSAKELSEMDFSGQQNMFFTPNSLGYRNFGYKSSICRRNEYLQTFECLFCDIDLKAGTDPELELQKIIESDFGKTVPYPSMVNCSGNGLHLFWYLESTPYKGNIEKWKAAQKYIYNCFKYIGSDIKVTEDAVRVLRIPGTLNHKENKSDKMCYTISENGSIFNLDDFIKEYVKDFGKKENKAKKTRKCSNKKKNNIIDFNRKLYLNRANDLEILLLKHRDKFNRKDNHIPGRESILFLYRYYMLEYYNDNEIALKLTLSLNSRLNNSLSVKEVEKSTKSAETYHYGNKLKWTNNKIIEWLEISEEEEKSLSYICTTRKVDKTKLNKEHYQKKLENENRISKAEKIQIRRIKIYELLEKGYNCDQICMKLHISKRTFYTDLKVVKSDVFIAAYKRMMKVLEMQKNTWFASAENMECRKFRTLNYIVSGTPALGSACRIPPLIC